MSNFDETLMKRLTKLEREVERLQVKERPVGGGGGVTDHGALTGLADNDHPQYLLKTGKAADSDKLDGIDSTGFATAGHDHPQYGRPVFLSTPLKSTSWSGVPRSTTAKTLIDLSAEFGAPDGIKGILVRLTARDSGSSAGQCQLRLSPNDTPNSAAIQCYLEGVANYVYVSASGIVPCNIKGDVYYQITASGSGTFLAFMEIWGYWL